MPTYIGYAYLYREMDTHKDLEFEFPSTGYQLKQSKYVNASFQICSNIEFKININLELLKILRGLVISANISLWEYLNFLAESSVPNWLGR